MNRLTVIAAGAAVALLGLAACDVQKTQEGNVNLPQYEVQKKAEGDVTLPKYDVKTPDVEVGSKTVEVTVPSVDVKTADEKRAEEGTAKK